MVIDVIFVRIIQLLSDKKFKCKATGRIYSVRGDLTCNSVNVIYIISCKNCHEQYVGSATNFKNSFKIHKSDIKTNKNRCGTARHFNNKCRSPQDPHAFLQVQLIETINNSVSNECNEELLWHREKYWQTQLFTNTFRHDSILDLYCNRKGCRIK